MPSEETGWKQALFGYVSTINEAALHTDLRKLRDIPDNEHRERLAQRLRLAKQREARWAIRPVRSEMRARIERFNTVRSEVVADISIHLVRSMEQRSQPWMEERVERERIRFVRIGKSWRLDSVKPLVAEWPAEAYPIEEDDLRDVWDGERKAALPSAPYINPQALYGFKSRVYAGASASDNEYGFSNGYGGSTPRGIPYLREAAVTYAERWWNEPNPAYENFEVNCTNYVSQCLFAGGAPMNYTGRRPSGWWYKGFSNKDEQWSFSWAVANSLQHYLSNPRAFGLRAEAVSKPESLKLGDVICYDWEGNGRVGHNTIVTAFTPDGMPLVNANTVSSRHRYWDYKDSYAWTEKTKYHFYRIADEF
ncbi:amidase domain-containing protein [Cohnella lupini]|uniref:Putative amidase-like protein n=1 Tax=Cohnella lupini TaxID=1294267 RepID=A0A3D9IMW1_9BACL|nr:amidase domain-containing protein [Cohnella lupini]RED63110.1 putative amidase-like protein [Cohnella lupini]